MSGPRAQGRGIVAAPQAEAAYEGARVLARGGNAADAAVTAALVQGVVDPHRCGIGGFGCATVRFDTGEGPRTLAIDFHGRAGSRAHESIWADIFEGPTPDGFGYLVRGRVNDVGYASITVPGLVAGLAEIHTRFGSLPWKELVEAAVPYAEDGFVVHPELAEFWIRPGLYGRVSTRDRLALTEEGRRICFKPGGEPYRAGEIFRQPELAETYRELARSGPESFYRGELARRIASDWERNGALVTAEDLAAYRARTGEPLRGRYRGLEIHTSPLPAGGAALLAVLHLLEHGPPLYGPLFGAARIDGTARILQAVWADRLENHADPEFGAPPAEALLAPERLAALLANPTRPQDAVESPGTTQLTIIDGAGNAVSLAHSLGYNSGVFAPGLGVLFNNCMSAFDPRPGRRNSIAPGKARSTAIAETIVLRDGIPVLVLGSPGGARITAAVALPIVYFAEFGLSVAEAAVAPRYDAYGPGTLLVESRFPYDVARELERRGWNVARSPKPFGVVGRVYAAGTDRLPPRIPQAGVDPGAPGAAFRDDEVEAHEPEGRP